MTEVDKRRVGAAFDRAAQLYEATAQFQHEVVERLMKLLQERRKGASFLAPACILDGGCGTGYGASLLQQVWPDALVVGCDLAPGMAGQAQARGVTAVCGDLERLPFADGAFDLIWSSLALQWCQPDTVFAELCRVLRPGGVLVFTSLGPGTLHELATAFAGIDAHSRVLPFLPPEQVTAALHHAGFEQVAVQTEDWVTHHPDFKTLLGSIRGIGANQIGGNQRAGMMGKTAWQAAQSRYESLRDPQGRLPATYRVVLSWAQNPG
jgi:malonyl-CoA O-methyltransferase